MKKHLVTTKIGIVELGHIVEVPDDFSGDLEEVAAKIKDATVRKYMEENELTDVSDLPEVSYWHYQI